MDAAGNHKRLQALARAAVGVLLLGAAAAVMLPFRGEMARALPAVVFVVPIAVAGLVAGRAVAIATAAAAAGTFNALFIPPYATFGIHGPEDIVAFVVFGFVAIVVGTLVSREGERRQVAEQRASDLETLNAELQAVEQERQRLAEEANKAAILERLDEQRSALLRSVSHDLRTPLGGISAIVSDLLSGTAYDEATRAELLGLVASETERLDRLVANLLSMSRVEAGALKPDCKPFAIDEVVTATVRRLGRLFAGRRVQLELPSQLPLVRGDYVQLEQVITNLLENAARHAPPSSTVRVGGRDVGSHVEVWIDDEGSGVRPFERERIFQPFRVGDGSSSTGMGLAICKAIVDAHGGTISVDNAPYGGARFSFRVPKA